MEVEVEVADLVKLGDVRTLDLMADLMDDRDVLLTNLLQAEAIIELLNRMEMMMWKMIRRRRKFGFHGGKV